MNTERQMQAIFLVGRCLAGGMYLWSGTNNLLNLDATAAFAGSKGLPLPQLGVALASLLLVAGGISLITGIHPRLGVAAIALFLVSVTPVMHNWWALDGMDRAIQLFSFEDNVGLFGSALVFVAIPTPWQLSLEPQFDAILGSLRTIHLRRRIPEVARG